VQFFKRELAWAYPTGWDQAVYLSRAYDTFDSIVKDGLLAGLLHGLRMITPTGMMMHLQTGLLLLVTGPSRLSALSINFIYFALLQCVAVDTLLWLTKRWSVAFLGVGLLLTTQGRFQLTGGMADFRLDHIAFCLFGIFVCLAIRSEVFVSRRWSLAAALAAAMLVLFRFQSAVTLAASLLVLLAILALKAWRSVDAQIRRAALRRVRGLLSTAMLVAVLVLPGIWPLRRELLHYYVGQVATDVQVRAQEYGAPDRFTYWTFYVRSLTFAHLGSFCCVLALGILVALFAAYRLRPRVRKSPAPEPDLQVMRLFLLVMLFVPLAVLTLWPIRNPLVGNILITPALGLVMSAVVAFAGRNKSDLPVPFLPGLVAVATLAFSCGVLFDLAMSARKTYLSANKESVNNVIRFCDEIAERSREMGWTEPRFSTDRAQEFLAAELQGVLSYERHGFLLRPTTLLGNSIQPVSTASALQAVKDSDFAVISDLSSPEAPGFSYPYNLDMKKKAPELHRAAEKFLAPLHHYQVFGHGFTLYMRPSAQVLGDSGGWITEAGLILIAPAEMLQARPKIELSGVTILAEHLGTVTLKAQVRAEGREPQEAPAKLDLSIVPKQATPYKAVISLDRNQLPGKGDVEIKLLFGTFFVPKEIGLNSDTRRLVIMTPKQVSLTP
jgi:hypothetical protein